LILLIDFFADKFFKVTNCDLEEIKFMANLMPLEKIENKIYLIRSQKVMLDRDLAELYAVKTGALIQAVKRNKERFPNDFMFQLIKMEAESMVSQNVIPSKRSLGGRMPYVFTEQGVAMLSTVLKSKKAIEVNITIMRAFVKIRNLIYSYKDLADKIAKMEKTYDKKIGEIFKILDFLADDKKSNKKEIGFKYK
jgi:hypothetical protein